VREQNVVLGLIEYHGEQHYGAERFFGLSGERADKAFASIQKRDAIKVAYCAKNSIPLIVVPYRDKAEIEIRILKFLKQL